MARINAKDIPKRIGRSLRRNWGLKLASLLFALLLWNYVIVEVNPTRTVTYNNVEMELPHGIAQLNNAGLAVKGDIDTYLKSVSVSIDLPRNQMQALDAGDLKAWVDLSDITQEGKQAVKVHVDPPTGTLRRISPATITVTVEKLAKRTVPVVCRVTGSLPAGYWSPAPTLNTQFLQISGAESDVDRVQMAIVQVSLDGQTKDFTSAEDFVLVDKNGGTTPLAGLTVDPPNCVVSFPVLHTKTVPIDASACLSGNPAQSYEVKGSPQLSQSSIEIAGPDDVLATIGSLPLGRVDISGASRDVTQIVSVQLPQGVQAVSGGSVTINVDVGMVMVTRTVSGIPVTFDKLPAGLKADKNYTGSVTFTCPELSVPGLLQASFHLVADASGADAGQETLALTATYDDAQAGLTNLMPAPAKVTVKFVATP